MIQWAMPLLLLSTVPAGAVDAYYETYAAGANVAAVNAQLEVGADTYRISLDFHTLGALSLMFNSRQRTTVDGRFVNGGPVPSRFFSSGTLRGDLRVTQIDYPGGQPVIRQLVPPSQSEREPVPLERQQNTVDTLSAMAGLLYRVSRTGRCEGGAMTYDGRRLATLQARTSGMQLLEPTGRSSFTGLALRCEFIGRQIGGFMLDEDQERLRRPQEGSAWFAKVDGVVIPVRIAFHTRWFGDATIYLAARPQ